ncbi:S-methyl-5-thioribose kinase [Ammoniphilus sp. CFH 90114]|uniref:S-methyl-5-thioribose kinase n=1 Tax=Ammoniphilus sp. CFH 90114 TaxID=2493665 RepID=UPI00100F0216|nr:S-methyl-5-thioribose kinase [Ammoniphilus sp. CFH 90114]RXT04838.1 S-methyl-5-thioribose kinase [Ammoniphilus sp. CFH 90114]
MEYRAFSEQEAVEYARQLPGIFPEGAQFESREIGDGNLNLVFHIEDKVSGKSIIFKQALPYARVVGESWPLTLDRARIESEALIIQDKLCPGLVPQVYHYDKDLALTVMEDLSSHVIMRKGLIEGNRYPLFAEHIGVFLAKTLFFTSDFALDFKEKKEKVEQFINPELCKITEDLVFTDPYYDAETNNFNPLIRDVVEGVWRNEVLKQEIAKLKYSFMTEAQALLHGDLHTGSIMVTEESTKVIDPEFAYYGPMGFDIGAVIANLLLNYAAQEGLKTTDEERGSYREYLLTSVVEVWNTFEKEFRRLCEVHIKDVMYSNAGFINDRMASLLRDSIGFAGCKMMRRVIGLAGVADLNSIQDEKVRAQAETLALSLGQTLVLQRGTVSSIEDVVEMVKKTEE